MTRDAAQPAPIIVAEPIKKAGRRVFQTGVALLCIWTLLPIYLLVANALSSPAEVNGFPKAFVPSFDLESIRFFVEFDGVLHELWTSIKVAMVTMFMSIGIGAPAGYALSRFDFPGKLVAASPKIRRCCRTGCPSPRLHICGQKISVRNVGHRKPIRETNGRDSDQGRRKVLRCLHRASFR